MRVLVTGSAGHLGEAMVRALTKMEYEVVGIDILDSPYTSHRGSVADRSFVKNCMNGVKIVYHTATLHKPHVATHSLQEFVDNNITGTLNLLEEAVAAGVECFIFTSTTSVFGDAMIPGEESPSVWVTEELRPVPKNIYGVTKKTAEEICQLFYRNHKLPVIILRTSRFFPEEDDNREMRESYSDENLKANEFLFRRVEIEDVVNAHLAASKQAVNIGFGVYIVSATTPFRMSDIKDLRIDALSVVRRLVPEYEKEYRRRGWRMFPTIDRVYVNEKARNELGWYPVYDFKYVIERLKAGNELRSPLARIIGSKGYHLETFEDGPYPVN